MRLADLRGRAVAVWGTGREGRAAVLAIARHDPASLVAVDDSENFLSLPWEPPLSELAPLRGEFAALAGADVVVRSPGVPQTHPWVIELRRRGAPITSGTALWMAEHADRTVAVTGSKGKSTTSSLISHLLTAAGRPNVYGGNIGVPVLDLPDGDRYVLELSSYQCSDLTDSPRVAAVTALFPEHLDAHGGEREYYRDKLNLIRHGPETVVVNGLDERLRSELGDVPAVRAGLPDSYHVSGGWFCKAGVRLFERSALPLVGRHNEVNLCVALAVLSSLGVDPGGFDVAGALASFSALPHRLTEIADPSGLTFVDDTLATSPYATMHAIDAYPDRPLTVIVGGADRGVDYGPLRDHLAQRSTGETVPAGTQQRATDDRRGAATGPSAITVIGIPDSGPRILEALKDLPSVRTELADDLSFAVRLARELTPAGGAVLLSPGAPSYGRYRNFEHRSEAFRAAIESTRP